MRASVEARLVGELASARELAAPRTHALRRDSAIAAQHASVTTFLDYCRENAAELLRTIRVEADAATASYTEAHAASEEILREPTARRQAAGELVTALVPCLGGGDFPHAQDWTIPADLAVVPMPRTALDIIERARDVAAYDERRADEAEAVRLRAEQSAVDARDRDLAVRAAGEELGHLIAKGHRGELAHVERESLARGTHPLQIDMERLRSGTLSEAREALHDVTLAGMRGLLNAADSAALAHGDHAAQSAVERLTTEVAA
jgi:hypothetical protein